MPEFIVDYKRLGKHRGVRRIHKAPTMGALEAPIQEFAESVLGKGEANANITVTIDTAAETGQLDYGLKGEFTISAI
jgi:hypothetical protein